MNSIRFLILPSIVLLLGGCATNNKVDPLEPTNRFFYSFNENLDKYALKPLSDAYVKVVPHPVRNGILNGFNNMEYTDVILNDFLQANFKQGLSDSGRMAVNSTVGIAGIFDPATKWNMPAHENDFGVTLGRWGFGPGPYLMLPFFGPSSARDVNGLVVGFVDDPLFWLDLDFGITAGVTTLEAVARRADAESALRFRNAAAIDPYVFTRDAYLQYRENLIHPNRPKPQQENIYDEDIDDSGPTTTTAPATEPATAPATQPKP